MSRCVAQTTGIPCVVGAEPWNATKPQRTRGGVWRGEGNGAEEVGRNALAGGHVSYRGGAERGWGGMGGPCVRKPVLSRWGAGR